MAEFGHESTCSLPFGQCSCFSKATQWSQCSCSSPMLERFDEFALCSNCGWYKSYPSQRAKTEHFAPLSHEPRDRYALVDLREVNTILYEIAYLLNDGRFADLHADTRSLLSPTDDLVDQLKTLPVLVAKLSYTILKESNQLDKLRQQSSDNEERIKELEQQLREKETAIKSMKCAINDTVDHLSDSDSSEGDVFAEDDVEDASEDAEASGSDEETDDEEISNQDDNEEEHEDLRDIKAKLELLMIKVDRMQAGYGKLVENMRNLELEFESFQIAKSIDDASIKGLKFNLEESIDELNEMKFQVFNTKAMYEENVRVVQLIPRLQSEVYDLKKKNETLTAMVLEQHNVDTLQASKAKSDETVGRLNEQTAFLKNQISYYCRIIEHLIENNEQVMDVNRRLSRKLFEQDDNNTDE